MYRYVNNGLKDILMGNNATAVIKFKLNEESKELQKLRLVNFVNNIKLKGLEPLNI